MFLKRILRDFVKKGRRFTKQKIFENKTELKVVDEVFRVSTEEFMF